MADPTKLEERGKRLEAYLSKLKSTPLMAVRLDVLKRVIDDLQANPELKSLFGEPVLSHLALVFDKASNEILLTDASIGDVDDASEIKFLKILRDIIKKEMR